MSPHIKIFSPLLFVLFLIKFSDATTRVSPVVSTTIGPIRGLVADDGDYYMYMGIPYAQVNRLNPFGQAIPQQPFDEVFDAIDDSAICPQIEEFNHTIVGNLDCLHINIYAPTTASETNPKAVMVMIYGGGFSIGFAGRFLYGPKFLVRHDVIFVTLNYRLGPYGFMCLNTPEIPGNEGLKDQYLALKWVKENIAQFGGDPNKITVFGNSAGAMSADFHLVSRREVLFNQMILQSGSSVTVAHTANENAPFQLAAHLGYVTNDLNEAIAFLAVVNENVMIAATNALGLSFGACIENQFEGVDGFLIEDWVRAPLPEANNMPIMQGITNNELIVFINLPGLFLNDEVFRSYLNNRFDITAPDFQGIDEIVQRFYIGDEDITMETSLEIIDFMADATFNHGAFRTTDKYLENQVGDIYFFVFSYVGERNFVRHKDNITQGGAAHADELGYLFDVSYFDTPNAEDQLFIDRLTTLWTNFAKFSNPTPETSELIPVLWEPIKNNSVYHYLDLNLELTPGTRPFNERMSFWDLLYAANAGNERFPTRD